MKSPSLTIGIEEEYQIIDPETRELRSYITEILSGDHLLPGITPPVTFERGFDADPLRSYLESVGVRSGRDLQRVAARGVDMIF